MYVDFHGETRRKVALRIHHGDKRANRPDRPLADGRLEA